MPATTENPNILLITSDQQHWSTLGVLNPRIKTPNLDRLAGLGTVFERAYCPNPTCTPSRASIITGLYPSQHGAYNLGTKLDESVPTLGDRLQPAGYDCSLIGKAHLQPLKSTERHPSLESYPLLQDLEFWRGFHGPFYGFNHVELARNHGDEAHVGQHYALWMEEKGCPDWKQHFRPPTGTTEAQYGAWNLPAELHLNEWIAERSINRLEQCATSGQPFFLWSSFFDPHPPYVVPEPWASMYDPAEMEVPGLVPGEHDANPPHFGLTQTDQPDFSPWFEDEIKGLHGFSSHLRARKDRARDMAIYYGMVSYMDAAIGRILDRLDTLGLSENTLVVFTSDHGHVWGQHGLIAKGPFHYEDLIRVPFVVRWPGRVPAGQHCGALQSLVDLAPSFLAAVGCEVPGSMSGVDQTAVWRQSASAARNEVLIEHRHQPTTVHVRTYVDQRYKLTVYLDRDYGELFDLETDPGELRNLWGAPEARELKAELMQRLVFAGMRREPMPMPRVSGA